MKQSTLAWIIPLAAATGGCASTPEVRTLSDKTGTYVTSLREGTAEFVADQNRLNAQNEAHLQRLEAKAALTAAQVARQRLAWTKGDRRGALETQELASSVSAADVVAELKPRTVQPATVSFAGGKGYSDAAEALTGVSAKPSTLAILRGLASYASQVRTSYEDLRKEASEASEQAGSAAGVAAAAAENPGVPVTPLPNP